jgi:hypothetical protein
LGNLPSGSQAPLRRARSGRAHQGAFHAFDLEQADDLRQAFGLLLERRGGGAGLLYPSRAN